MPDQELIGHAGNLERRGVHGREVSDHGVQVQFSHTAVPTVPSDAALCVFRVVQEALANIVKHSGTTTARVTMIGATDTILLRVEDGGCGFVPTHAAEGLGLVSMRERVRSAGGELSIRSMPGQGTAIEARVPIHHAGTPSGDTTELSLPFDTCPPLSVLLERSESSTG